MLASFTDVTVAYGLSLIHILEIMERERDNLALVLLDVMMPDIDGYEVLEYMNFNGLLKHTPVIMVTAADSAEDEEKCLRLGAMDFVRKPYVTDVVKRRVKNIVELYLSLIHI